MKRETIEKLQFFEQFNNEATVRLGDKYIKFEPFLKDVISGQGMIGENSYLILWKSSKIEELNDAYEVQEFLSDIILIGSNGGGSAYGLNSNGEYIEVPFIGMDDEEVEVIAKSFDEFITYLYNK